ncbi:hypothetical protein SO802_021907 [Lithocarpus litseifolius]|uniref:CCHC-type domain-containing protein n=1 Tax=Lithocarpus litseifolius TaxID=425828 RepID=A0AAW2CGF3_9ROSI
MEDDAKLDEEVEALQQGSIGKVLREETFTATKSRDRFARLCIQLDVEKPLVTTILIGKFEQLVSNEGMQKLCFRCGRMGHRKEACLYIICHDSPFAEAEKKGTREMGTNSCNARAPDNPRSDKEPREDIQVDVQGDVHEGTYGPWVVVPHRKNGTKAQRSGGPFTGQVYSHALRGKRMSWQEGKESNLSSRAISPNGPTKEAKRKQSPLRIAEKMQILNAIQPIGEEAMRRAQPPSIHKLILEESTDHEA